MLGIDSDGIAFWLRLIPLFAFEALFNNLVFVRLSLLVYGSDHVDF